MRSPNMTPKSYDSHPKPKHKQDIVCYPESGNLIRCSGPRPWGLQELKAPLGVEKRYQGGVDTFSHELADPFLLGHSHLMAGKGVCLARQLPDTALMGADFVKVNYSHGSAPVAHEQHNSVLCCVLPSVHKLSPSQQIA